MKNLKCEECVFFDELDTEQPCCCCFDNIHFEKQTEEYDHPTEKVCTGKRCPMQVGYDVKNCKDKDCIYRTEAEKGGVKWFGHGECPVTPEQFEAIYNDDTDEKGGEG